MIYSSLISAEDSDKNLENPNWRIVDCRFSLDDPEHGRNDFRTAHIPNAIYAHLNDDLSAPVIPGKTGRHPLPEIDSLAHLFSEWGIDANIQVVAYDDATGAIAARLWRLLRWLGHEKVAVLDGGWQAWKEKGYPETNRTASPSPRQFIPMPRPELLVDSAMLEKVIDRQDYVVIDARARERFTGENEPIDPVAGHIPTAKNAPYTDNLDEANRFLNKNALRRRYIALLGSKSAGEAIFYCGSGVTACHNLLALHHAGLGDSKLYAGSWSEWIVDPARPVACLKTRDSSLHSE